MNAAQGGNGLKCRERSDPATRKRNGVQREAFGLYRSGAIDDTRCDMHVVAGIASRAGHREPMR
jgi:hypothetical protein